MNLADPSYRLANGSTKSTKFSTRVLLQYTTQDTTCRSTAVLESSTRVHFSTAVAATPAYGGSKFDAF